MCIRNELNRYLLAIVILLSYLPVTAFCAGISYGTSYIAPNETQPIWQQPLLQTSPPGLQVSVGTERGFITAAINPNTQFLLLADRDTNVILFNRINIALLRMAKNREDYLKLRFAKDQSEWKSVLSSADPEVSQLLESNEAWEFWQKNVLRNGKFSAFHAANGAEFTSANYLYDSSLYNRVASLAKRGKIEPMLANLSDLSGQQALAAKLKSLHLPLSVLDISNAWQPRYLERKPLASLVQTMKDFAKPNSLLLISRRNFNIGTSKDGVMGDFVFEGFSSEKISNSDRFASILQRDEHLGALPNAALNPDHVMSGIEAKSFLDCSFFRNFAR